MLEAIEKIPIQLKVNGKAYSLRVEPRILLVELLREHLDLTGTHVGCDTSYCGACTVLLNGRAVKSCTVLAVQADGGGEVAGGGRPPGGEVPTLLQGFWGSYGFQCGVCAPWPPISGLPPLPTP